MKEFTFYMPTKVFFGKGQIAKVRDAVPADAKILITYGGGSVLKNGVMEQVKAALAGRSYIEFGGIEPNPEYETLMKAVDIVRKNNIDFLLPIGGGSVLDGTKFIAAAALYDGEGWDIMLTGGKHVTRAVPIGTVLTLPATGSEMNDSGVISRRETGDKLSFHAEQVIPRFAVLDPETTFSLPARQIANGVVDTFVHVCEQYMTYPTGSSLTDRFAESILKTLMEDGPRALADPMNYDVRASIVWCATMGLNDLLVTGHPQDWVTHLMGHAMTALYGLDHARTLAIVMPSLWDYCRADKREKLLQFASRVLGITEGSDDERVDLAIAKVRQFFTDMGNPTYFSDYQLDGSGIPVLVAKLRERGNANRGERGNLNPDDMEKIYNMCLRP